MPLVAHRMGGGRTHTHTHPFNGPLSGTTRVGRYQKGKTNLDFTGARESEWQWHQLGTCKSAPHSRQITTPAPHHSVFYRPDALPAAQPTASKHWRPGGGRTKMSNQITFIMILQCFVLPSVLWRCWLGGRKGIRPVKKLSGVVLAWLSVWI